MTSSTTTFPAMAESTTQCRSTWGGWQCRSSRGSPTWGLCLLFMLVLAGELRSVDHRHNQHELGGDNLEGSCRSLHPISLLHWSGKGKPWLRLDSRRPCSVFYLLAPLSGSHCKKIDNRMSMSSGCHFILK